MLSLDIPAAHIHLNVEFQRTRKGMDYKCPTWFFPLHVWEERGILEKAQDGEHHCKSFSSSPLSRLSALIIKALEVKTRLAYTIIYPVVWSFAENWQIVKLKGLPKARYSKTAAVTVIYEGTVDKLKNSPLHSSTYPFLWKSYLLILLFSLYNHSLSLAMNESCGHGHFAFCRGEPKALTFFHIIMLGDSDLKATRRISSTTLLVCTCLVSYCLLPMSLALHPT